jgi:hypothetical protein
MAKRGRRIFRESYMTSYVKYRKQLLDERTQYGPYLFIWVNSKYFKAIQRYETLTLTNENN